MTRKSVSARGRKANKPSKPRKDFPLFAHGSGQWAKKLSGKLFYFGTWDDPNAAETKWERDKIAILDGRNPNDSQHGDSIEWLCNTLMDEKAAKCNRGELTKETLNDYLRICKHVAAFFSKSRRVDTLTPRDFSRYRNALPATWAPTTVNNHLRYVRAVFKFANEEEIAKPPLNYTRGLALASKPVVKKHEAKKPAKEFSAKEVWALHDAASIPMRAFILLGINAAYGTADIGRLTIDAIDFDAKWLGDARGKTGVARGCWLWPETTKALKAAFKSRPATTIKRLDQLAFLTRDGQPWYVDGSTSRPLTQAFGKLKKDLGIDRTGVGHYSLRHTFATVANDSHDQQAVDYVMGHDDPSMRAVYREGIDPKRIKAVCQHVRKWFKAGAPKKGGAK